MSNNYYFEIVIFFYLIDNKLIGNFEKKYFTEPTIVSIFDYTKDFVKEYKVSPSADQIIEIVKLHGKEDLILPDTIYDLWKRCDDYKTKYSKEWLEKSCAEWGKYRSFYTGLETTIAYVQSWPQSISYEECGKYISKASDIFNKGTGFTMNQAAGHNFFDFDTHQIPAHATHTTGYNFIDLALNGGFSEKELYVFVGAPKSGKSMWLCSLAANSVRNGFNTLYITLELSYQKVSQRIGANLFNIPMDDYKKAMADPNFFEKAVEGFYKGNGLKAPGEFYVEEFPTSSLTVSELENFVTKKRDELRSIKGENFNFENIVIDYINIMRDQKGSQAGDTYNKIKNICEDLRAMGQRLNSAIISVTQTNRGGMDASDMQLTNISESTGLIATVDALIAIIRTMPMRTDNVYYLKALAMRDSIQHGNFKKYNMDPRTLRITEDESEGIIPENEGVPQKYRSALDNEVDKYNKNHPKYQTYKPEDEKPASTVQTVSAPVSIDSMYKDVVLGSPNARIFAETPKI